MPAPRILLVDDCKQFRALARELLERRGYRIAAETDCATTTMSLAAVLDLDAVLIDVHLPDQDGFELAARLAGSYPALAVLLTSADWHETFYALAAASGARGFVPKSCLAQAELVRFWPNPGRNPVS